MSKLPPSPTSPPIICFIQTQHTNPPIRHKQAQAKINAYSLPTYPASIQSKTPSPSPMECRKIGSNLFHPFLKTLPCRAGTRVLYQYLCPLPHCKNGRRKRKNTVWYDSGTPPSKHYLRSHIRSDQICTLFQRKRRPCYDTQLGLTPPEGEAYGGGASAKHC